MVPALNTSDAAATLTGEARMSVNEPRVEDFPDAPRVRVPPLPAADAGADTVTFRVPPVVVPEYSNCCSIKFEDPASTAEKVVKAPCNCNDATVMVTAVTLRVADPAAFVTPSVPDTVIRVAEVPDVEPTTASDGTPSKSEVMETLAGVEREAELESVQLLLPEQLSDEIVTLADDCKYAVASANTSCDRGM